MEISRICSSSCATVSGCYQDRTDGSKLFYPVTGVICGAAFLPTGKTDYVTW